MSFYSRLQNKLILIIIYCLLFFSMYFEKLLVKSILALNDHKTIEPLKVMVENEQESKSQFVRVVRRYAYL